MAMSTLTWVIAVALGVAGGAVELAFGPQIMGLVGGAFAAGALLTILSIESNL
jgi:hypothetical protein